MLTWRFQHHQFHVFLQIMNVIGTACQQKVILERLLTVTRLTPRHSSRHDHIKVYGDVRLFATNTEIIEHI